MIFARDIAQPVVEAVERLLELEELSASRLDGRVRRARLLQFLHQVADAEEEDIAPHSRDRLLLRPWLVARAALLPLRLHGPLKDAALLTHPAGELVDHREAFHGLIHSLADKPRVRFDVRLDIPPVHGPLTHVLAGALAKLCETAALGRLMEDRTRRFAGDDDEPAVGARAALRIAHGRV